MDFRETSRWIERKLNPNNNIKFIWMLIRYLNEVCCPLRKTMFFKEKSNIQKQTKKLEMLFYFLSFLRERKKYATAPRTIRKEKKGSKMRCQKNKQIDYFLQVL